ncbi:phosphate ABC transporter membrane protein 2 (PhoT family) [Nocardioides albertanoniae]|uniref:Phosphate transport system permease protein PstA n=1 Tax=Nocardioides albertanoniae TaxID=1175486 RepID=A0A543A2X4_9ACTN|nr:phosphate ABC transporter permease PstA [Nocardioides albertanoniae]TQL66930.1 phosphate ABC transporter membrane protein 2 (PhoT family) [Nocardioides albertanoniae]
MTNIDPSVNDTAQLETRLSHATLPRGAQWLVGIAAVALGGLALVLGLSIVAAVAIGLLGFLIGYPLWALLVENKRSATDKLITGLVWTAFGVAVIPLIWLVYMVFARGLATISPEFLTYSMRSVTGDDQGGLYHALMGTLIVTGIAAVISIPIGIMTAIYLIEYGKGNRLARSITFLVDVMTGIPSIVAGLFAFALFTLIVGPGTRFGFGGGVALSLLMIPTVVRSTEEMLKLVPDDLREASYALGVPKWRTITRMVLPTAIGGIVTGVVLAISRVIGETAPLLVASGFNPNMNGNAFDDSPMMTVPVFIYTQLSEATGKGVEYAWGGALVLFILVMVLNLIARIIGTIFAPKTGR